MQNTSSRLRANKGLWGRVGTILTLAVIGSSCTLSVQAQTYDATTDYNTNLVTGTNPNGAWTYGWSTNPTGALTLYTQHHNVVVGLTANAWDDPTHLFSHVPLVYKNTGPDYPDDGNISIPAGALILHGGGPNGSGGFENDFSQVVFTAPTAGNYALTSAFQLRQHNVLPAGVEVLKNGAPLFTGTLTNFLDTASYANSFLLNTGDKLDFSVGFASPPTGVSGNSVEFNATLVRTAAATPEPSSVALLTGMCVSGASFLTRRRKKAQTAT